MKRCYLIDAEPVTLTPDDGPWIDLNDRREEEVAFGPTAGLEALGCHAGSVLRKTR
jgi:hypothetical protein